MSALYGDASHRRQMETDDLPAARRRRTAWFRGDAALDAGRDRKGPAATAATDGSRRPDCQSCSGTAAARALPIDRTWANPGTGVRSVMAMGERPSGADER